MEFQLDERADEEGCHSHCVAISQDQQHLVKSLQDRLLPYTKLLSVVIQAEEECVAANVDENDYTVFTSQDLAFELELVVQSIVKKISFIDNQASLFLICHGNTPAKADGCDKDCVQEHDEPDSSPA